MHVLFELNVGLSKEARKCSLSLTKTSRSLSNLNTKVAVLIYVSWLDAPGFDAVT